jgi:hypothetical protein
MKVFHQLTRDMLTEAEALIEPNQGYIRNYQY